MFTKKQKIRVSIVCAVFVIITFLSIFLIAGRADHDCRGENCPVCACIHQAEKTLQQLGNGTVEAIDFQPAIEISVLALACAFLFAPCTSLISQKVRLND